MNDRTSSLIVALLLGGMCGVVVAVECTHVATSCAAWGAGQGTPPFDYWCCVAEHYTGHECGTGVKSVTLSEPPPGPGLECGRLERVEDGICNGVPEGSCGGLRAYDGCTSKNCGSGS